MCASIAPSPTLAIDAKAKEMRRSGRDVVSFSVGEPDFVTPQYIRTAAHEALDMGLTKYTPAAGTLGLRRAICEKLRLDNGLEYSPSQVIVSNGAKFSIYAALAAIVNPGDEVIIPDPSYVSYMPNVAMVYGIPVPVPTKAEDDFRITPEEIERAVTKKTKAIILPYPNNPTGAVMKKEHLEEIAKVIQKHDLIVLSDEIYSELTYGSRHVSIASMEDMRQRTILINGFSKSFAMTGWRVGFVCAPEEVLAPMLKIHQYVIMCASTMSQAAAENALVAGFTNDFADIKKMHDDYDMRRRVIYRQLNDMGLSSFEPKGAFYIFPCIKSTRLTSDEFATRLLEQEHVAVVPGTAFGPSGEGFVRCSYASSLKNIHEAMARIRHFLERLHV